MDKELPKMNEKEFTKLVIEMAEALGWRCYHARPAWQRDGKMVTPIQGKESAGFPDICMVKHFNKAGRVRFMMIELKVGKNKASEAQAAWLYDLKAAGIPCGVFYPDDLDSLEGLLR